MQFVYDLIKRLLLGTMSDSEFSAHSARTTAENISSIRNHIGNILQDIEGESRSYRCCARKAVKEIIVYSGKDPDGDFEDVAYVQKMKMVKCLDQKEKYETVIEFLNDYITILSGGGTKNTMDNIVNQVEDTRDLQEMANMTPEQRFVTSLIGMGRSVSVVKRSRRERDMINKLMKSIKISFEKKESVEELKDNYRKKLERVACYIRDLLKSQKMKKSKRIQRDLDRQYFAKLPHTQQVKKRRGNNSHHMGNTTAIAPSSSSSSSSANPVQISDEYLERILHDLEKLTEKKQTEI